MLVPSKLFHIPERELPDRKRSSFHIPERELPETFPHTVALPSAQARWAGQGTLSGAMSNPGQGTLGTFEEGYLRGFEQGFRQGFQNGFGMHAGQPEEHEARHQPHPAATAHWRETLSSSSIGNDSSAVENQRLTAFQWWSGPSPKMGWWPYENQHQVLLMEAWEELHTMAPMDHKVVRLQDKGWEYVVTLGILTEPAEGHTDVVGWQSACNDKGKTNRRRWVRCLLADNTDFLVSTNDSEKCETECKPPPHFT